MAPPEDAPAGRRHPLACPTCDSRLNVDQRYCVVCGTRVRPLPASVAAPLAALSAGLPALLPGRVAAPAAAALNPDPAAAEAVAAPSTVGPHGRPVFEPTAIELFGSRILLPSFEMPSPSAAAATLLGILAFFVVVTQGNTLANSAVVFLGGGTSQLPVTVAPAPTAPSLTPGASVSASAPAASAGSSAAATPASPAAPASGGGTAPGTQTATTPTSTTATPTNLPPIKHVWVITLGDQAYTNTFSTVSSDTYLNKTLAQTGEVLPAFYGVTSSDLGNEDALLSGQGPTPQILQNCPTYDKVSPGLKLGTQVSGDGCVFNANVPTLLSQLTAAKLTWKAYVQGLGGTSALRVAARRAAVARSHRTGRRRIAHATGAATCRHPALGASDTATASPTNGYVTWRNPVVYFESVTPSDCANLDVGLNSLSTDLKSAKATPTLSLVYADPCSDGSDTGPGTPCPSVPDATNPATNADAFLQSVVPRIEASPAYANGQGLILIQFAMAAQSGPHVGQFPQAACCNTPQYPNLAGQTTTTTPGTTTPGTTTPGTTTTDTVATTTTTGTSTGGSGAATVTGTAGTSTGGTDTATVGTVSSTTDTSQSSTATTPPCPTTGTTTTGTDTTSTGAPVTATTGTDTGTVAATATAPTGTSTTGTSTTGTCTGTTTTQTTPAPATDPLGNPATGGGGQIGLLAISKWVTKGSQDVFDTFDTFSLEASLEKLFGLTPPLGYASTVGVTGIWGHGFFSAFSPSAAAAG